MNLTSLVVIIIRLLSLDFLLRAALQTAPQLFQFIVAQSETARSLIPPTIIYSGILAMAVALWLLATPVARLVTHALPQEVSAGALSLADLYSVGFISIGLYYVINRITPSIFALIFLLKVFSGESSSIGPVNWYEVMDSIVPLLAGLALFFRGRRWACVLSKQGG